MSNPYENISTENLKAMLKETYPNSMVAEAVRRLEFFQSAWQEPDNMKAILVSPNGEPEQYVYGTTEACNQVKELGVLMEKCQEAAAKYLRQQVDVEQGLPGAFDDSLKVG